MLQCCQSSRLGNAVNVLYNDALCTDNREVTTYDSGTVFLHWNSALCNSNDARCNDSQIWCVSLRLGAFDLISPELQPGALTGRLCSNILAADVVISF